MNTEITDNIEVRHGWVLYDGDCTLCIGLAKRWGRLLGRHGFGLAAIQEPWVAAALGREANDVPGEMALLAPGRRYFSGADALIQIARSIWWAWPLAMAAGVPGVRPILRRVYAFIAAHRHCLGGRCRVPPGA